MIHVDIPFDPNANPVQAAADPNISVSVDPTMPPCPGPLLFVVVSSKPLPGGGGRQDVVMRPVTPVPLYIYRTWVRMKPNTPVLVMCDTWAECPRELFPLSEYIIVESALFDSKVNSQADLWPMQWARSDPSGDQGALCWAQLPQGERQNFDTIRHVIAVHPVELKIPFVLKDIPIPSIQGGAK
jgi:hypothetical protein